MLKSDKFYTLLSFGFIPRIIPVFLLSIIYTSKIYAQNLVPNGDFEYYTQCPTDFGQVTYAYPWYLPSNGSSDYYNECVTTPGQILNVDVPGNSYGFQYAHSGKGYCGIAKANNDMNYFEYVATCLARPLEKNTQYCLELFISKTDTSCLHLNKLGVFFSNNPIYSDSNFLNLVPQINILAFNFDKDNWQKYEANFLANGGELYMCIGLFDTTGLNTVVTCNNAFSQSSDYIYIDDVSLTDCTNYNFVIPNVLSPNNDAINDDWFIESSVSLHTIIYNRWGNKVFDVTGNHIVWNGENCNEGVYFYQIIINDEIKSGFIQLIR